MSHIIMINGNYCSQGRSVLSVLVIIVYMIRSFSMLSTHEYDKILSRYSVQNLCSVTAELKRSLWQHFVDTAIFSTI